MNHKPLPNLLVSVRSPEEAEAALAGGAHVIDVKEPNHGSLGRADDQTIRAVLKVVDDRRPVSAALGELVDSFSPMRDPRLSFVKWGLTGCRRNSWKMRLSHELSLAGNPKTVVVAYADWQCAQAPTLDDVVKFACQKPGNVLLVDTHCKEPGTLHKEARPTLLDWITPEDIRALCVQCRAADVRVALAGCLGLAEIERLRVAAPDWFAVRGAVCDENRRQGVIDAAKVRQFVDLLRAV